jgi:manganese transport protein
MKLTVRPATAKYADPATVATPSSIAIVGTSAEGSAGPANSRFMIIELSSTQQITPIPNDASASACRCTCAAAFAPISPPAAVGSKYPGCKESGAMPPVIHWPVSQPPMAIVAARNTITSATDVAEFIGAALGLNLLFGVPMLPAGLITGLITLAVLGLRARGRRRFEQAIIALLGFVVAGFGYETCRLGPSVPGSLHGLVPGLDGAGSLYLAAAILGATVMPHVIYLHSALTKDRAPSRGDRDRARLLRFQQLDVLTALGLAGLVNMAMLAMAARAFHAPALAGLDTIGQAHAELGRIAGGGAALVFAVALLASGVSSSSVGTYAGEVIMAGFVRLRVPLLARRAVTMMPALAILAAGVNPTSALVLSQVALSFGIPFALVPLVILTGRRDVMGCHVNQRRTTVTGGLCVAVIIALNVLLLWHG